MDFWIASGIVAVVTGLTIALGFLRARSAEAAADEDLTVYRDQLREVDKDVARGILQPNDAERLRTEISRRILDADRTRGGRSGLRTTPAMARWTGIALVPVMLGGAFWVYTGVGAPGYGDLPLAQRLEAAREARLMRPSQSVAEAEATARLGIQGEAIRSRPDPTEEEAALVARLREVLADRPDDLEGHRLLAASEAALGDYAAAAAAQARVVAILGDAAGEDERMVLSELEALAGGEASLADWQARLADRPDDLEGHRELVRRAMALDDLVTAHRAQSQVVAILGDEATADDFVVLADLMIIAAGGYVSPEAEAALERALRREPRHPLARYFTGLMFTQNDRPDLAFEMWRQLLEDSEPDAPWVGPIRGQIEMVAMRAGINYSLPPAGSAAASRGPSEADIAAAAELDPEARADMIAGMVEGLAQRLSNQGGTAEDWARLIEAYGVLGRTDDARVVWNEAQAVFGGRPDDLAVIAEAAAGAGVAQ